MVHLDQYLQNVQRMLPLDPEARTVDVHLLHEVQGDHIPRLCEVIRLLTNAFQKAMVELDDDDDDGAYLTLNAALERCDELAQQADPFNDYEIHVN